MFSKGTMKDDGIDITIKNNPDHVLAPSDWGMVLDAKFGKIPAEEYKVWYHNLIRDRWESRRQEIIELAEKGKDKDVLLKCFCPQSSVVCHAHLAAEFLNALITQMKRK